MGLDGAEADGQLVADLAVGAPASGSQQDLGVEDHAQTCPDDVLVVSDQDSDGHGSPTVKGSEATTLQPRPGSGPARIVPPSRLARSAMPRSP